MNLEEAIKGMMETRAKLRSKRGISDPAFISTQMQVLTQFTSAIEEHLADYEEEHEHNMTTKFVKYTNGDDAISVSQAETKTRFESGIRKGEIAKLKRYVNSSWEIIKVAQSRVNHLTNEYKTGSKVT